MKETQSFGMTEFKVMEWAKARGIYENGTALGQALKAMSEVMELIEAIQSNDKHEIADALGDVLVCLVNTSVLVDMDLRQCFYKAFKEIEPRQGFMNANGQFVKTNV